MDGIYHVTQEGYLDYTPAFFQAIERRSQVVNMTFTTIWLGAQPPNPEIKAGLLGGPCG
jgi:hypothetical protein